MPITLPLDIGNYRLEKLIGSGGMGGVFLAQDTLLLRPVAVKILELATDNKANSPKESFSSAVNEGRLLARLNHPNIVQVFDVVKNENDTGLVMEHVTGHNLEQLSQTLINFQR